jgi:hypothetical protein
MFSGGPIRPALSLALESQSDFSHFHKRCLAYWAYSSSSCLVMAARPPFRKKRQTDLEMLPSQTPRAMATEELEGMWLNRRFVKVATT